jgi:hydroxylaminobenzene mutase
MARGTRDRLLWHGVCLFLGGLLMGGVTYALPNPRMGLSAHVGGVTTGTFLIAIGAGWDAVRLSSRDRHARRRPR